jgi:SAM-dependent methyltransferase
MARKSALVKNLAPAPTKLDLGCGPNKQPGYYGVDSIDFVGVDLVFDLTQPWPWADGSIEQVFSSHFYEHLTNPQRVHVLNELGRVLKTGGTATIIAPHWSNACAYGDPTHQWPPVTEWAALYWNAAWRASNAPHAGYTCDFDTVTGFGFDSRIQAWNQERQMFGLAHHLNAARDIHFTLTKRG